MPQEEADVHRQPGHPYSHDLIVVAVLFLCALGIGLTYLNTHGAQGRFYQHVFGPAVSWACGRGYENPVLSQTPELEDFLTLQVDRFDCADLPEDLELAPSGSHLDPNLTWLNLLGSAALIWRVFGVSWSGLYPFFAVLYGATVAAGYGLFRLGMRRGFAACCALMLAISPLHLQQLPHYRDYSKAPFILGALFIMGYLAKWPMRRRAVLILAALGGLTVGIGLGFRQDVNVCLPPFLVVLAIFLPGGFRRTVVTRLLAVAVFLGAYLVSAAPILYAFTETTNQPHLILLGLSAYCDQRLGVASPLYSFGGSYPYLDNYIRAIFQSYAQRMHGETAPLYFSTKAYDGYGMGYVLEIGKRFPADIALRAYASVLRVLDEMQVSVNAPAPGGVTHPALVAAYKARVLALNSLVGGGRYYAGLSLALLAGWNLRLALCALFLLLYFAGYPGAQFNLRHCFHLEFISLWTLGFLGQHAFDTVRRLCKPELRTQWAAFLARPKQWWCAPLRRVLLFAVIACTGITVPVAALRAYQYQAAGSLVQAVVEAPVEALDVQIQALGDGRMRLVLPGLAGRSPLPPEELGMPVRSQYLVIAFEDAGRPAVPLTLRYKSENPENDFTRTTLSLPPALSVGNGSGDTLGRVFTPVFELLSDAYEEPDHHFVGIELSAEHLPYLRGVSRVTDASKLPVLLNLSLPHDWDRRPLRQGFLW